MLSSGAFYRCSFALIKREKMKAVVIYGQEELPRYENFSEPTIRNDNEVLVSVKAVAIKHFDKGRASGKHYSADTLKESGRVIGGDGVCLLEDGTRVYAVSVGGMLAEKAIVSKDRLVKLPAALDDATGAALPNAVIGAAMALRFKADIQPGDVVLINGATGFTGRVAVQIAKYYGAKKVIATGRNQQSLQDLLSLGADEIISVIPDDEHFKAQVKNTHSHAPVDIIIDYLWGHTAEMILACLKGDGSFTNRIRYVSVGSVTGDHIRLSAANLRSVNLQLTGSGLGARPEQQLNRLFTEILPEMFQLAAEHKLTVQTITHEIGHIARLWDLNIPDGKRLVITV
jgi:NADPH:quinone reductase-like Zn-dependent oxidoreductase